MGCYRGRFGVIVDQAGSALFDNMMMASDLLAHCSLLNQMALRPDFYVTAVPNFTIFPRYCPIFAV
jgi:hypothetical protein